MWLEIKNIHGYTSKFVLYTISNGIIKSAHASFTPKKEYSSNEMFP